MAVPLGFRFILFAGVALLQEPSQRTARVDLMIGGGSESREEYSFVAISGLAFAPDARIVVTDIRDQAVRVYDSAGAFLYTVGRRGSGPGEYVNPVSASIDREGLLWIRDDGNRRYNSYELAAERATFRNSVRYEHAPSSNRIEPIPFNDFGQIVSIGAIRELGAASKPARFHIARDGRVVRVDTIRTPPADSTGDRSVQVKSSTPGVSTLSTLYYYQPFGPTFLVAHSLSGEWARVVTSRYDIEWFSADGRRLRTIRRSIEGPQLSPEERQRGQKAVDEFVANARVPASSIPGVPRRKMPVARIAFDTEGNLWVERSTADAASREAEVYNHEGRQITALKWAREIDLLGRQSVATSGSQVLGVASDSLGTQNVVRLTWR